MIGVTIRPTAKRKWIRKQTHFAAHAVQATHLLLFRLPSAARSDTEPSVTSETDATLCFPYTLQQQQKQHFTRVYLPTTVQPFRPNSRWQLHRAGQFNSAERMFRQATRESLVGKSRQAACWLGQYPRPRNGYCAPTNTPPPPFRRHPPPTTKAVSILISTMTTPTPFPFLHLRSDMAARILHRAMNEYLVKVMDAKL